jgi:quercetin 2,3-dioxygenase
MGIMNMMILKGHPTSDGAGVKLYRVFANDTTELTDPFLLLDHFGSDNPDDYIRGFPWHPHRGIETVTYMLDGEVEHEDSLGNKGVIGQGDIQWMSAGSGIIHQEMPKASRLMQGFQLWVNMPKKKKMIQPEYRGITKDMIPIIKKDGHIIKVISGKYGGMTGPVKDLVIDVEYLDIGLEKGKKFSYDIKHGHTMFCYVFEGSGVFRSKEQSKELSKGNLILIRDGEDEGSEKSLPKGSSRLSLKRSSKLWSESSLTVQAGAGIRFILVSGKPLKEPIAWGGPIVMNTDEELRDAFREIGQGTFVKNQKNLHRKSE